MYKTLIVLMMMCSSLSIYCQVTDSLKKVLAGLPETEQGLIISLHNQLAWEHRDNRPDSSLYHANFAYKLAARHGFKHEEIQSINYIGIAYRNLGNFSKAFEKYLEALKKAEDHNDQEQRGYSLINLGNLYLYQTNFDGAIRYFIQALDQAQNLANKRMVAYCFVNLGRSYIGIEEYGQAELYFKQAIELRKEIGDAEGVIAGEIGLADVFRLQGHLIKSLDYYLDLVERIKDSNNARALSQSYYNISRLYFTLRDMDNAEYYAHEGLWIAKSVSSRIDEKDLLNNLRKLYALQGRYEMAYDYFSNYAELNQQLFSEENIRTIEQLKNQYEIEKKETENEFLRQQDELNQKIILRQRFIIGLTALGILLFLVIVVVIYQAYLVRKRLSYEVQLQNDKIELDKNFIEKQSNKLKALDVAKSTFFANVSHDLRTPLSLILGNLEMIQEDNDSSLSPSTLKNIDIAFKNSKRLLRLTDEINDITRLEEGKLTLRKEVVKVDSYLTMLSEMFRGTAEFKGIKFQFNGGLGPMDGIHVDPVQFEKVFYNLVSNSIKYTTKGDSITIKTFRKDSNVFISFHDTGEGIPREALPYIFDRFYQSRNNASEAREGLGIGLALIKELVELHNGKIEVSSIPAIETVFTIILPYVEATNSGIVAPTTYINNILRTDHGLHADPSTALLSPKLNEKVTATLLIVDDHPEIRFHIRQVLEDRYHLLEASHGLEALDMLNIHPVDLIISDLMMPWMDGFELIEALRAHEEYSKIPVLVVSARITDKDQEKVLYKGINEYLQKPFKKNELILRINNLLVHRHRLEDKDNTLESFLQTKATGSIEKDIIAKVQALIMERIGDEHLSVLDIADTIAASERQVYRMVKKITGLTPYEYIMEVRMKYADYLIRKKQVKNASEAAKRIGLKNVTSFSKQFEKRFGCKPAELFQV